MAKGFKYRLMTDVKALDSMLSRGMFDDGPFHIGAEQEYFLVDCNTMRPLTIATAILEGLHTHAWLTPELAKFSLEANFQPRMLGGECFREMEHEARFYFNTVKDEAAKHGGDLVLTGILPTFHERDTESLEMRTAGTRYEKIFASMADSLNAEDFKLSLDHYGKYCIPSSSFISVGCTSSFQTHLQVSPDNFVNYYNIAQVITAPLLAVSANSPLMFGKESWSESRVTLYQQATDCRSPLALRRKNKPRTLFGDDWLDGSITDFYKKNISDFPLYLDEEVDEDSLAILEGGEVPALNALRMHSSTIYQWNRPCYGISSNGKPHLRIENRVLPAGPSIIDQIANKMFWVGMILGIAKKYEDIRSFISFDDVRDNFYKAASYGLETQFAWLEGRVCSADTLILEELLPIAKAGLVQQGIDLEDIERYLGVIQQRCASKQTGAKWITKSYEALRRHQNTQVSLASLTWNMIDKQKSMMPVHSWALSKANVDWQYNHSDISVEEFIENDSLILFDTEDVDIAYEMMQWKSASHLFVERNDRQFVGLLSLTELRSFTSQSLTLDQIPIRVPLSIEPQTLMVDALSMMQANNFTVIPVLKEGCFLGTLSKGKLKEANIIK